MKNERGFTLIELLVVIGILAVLFGLTALALTGVGADAKTNAMFAEKDIVQTAIDVYMAKAGVSVVTASATAAKVGPATAEFGTYLRRDSKYCYAWTAAGVLTQTETCP